jgi:hypothetical protein
MISALVLLAICGCSRSATPAAPQAGPAATSSPAIDPPLGYNAGVYRGFDRNDYPGDDAMITLHNTFAFTGYWLTNPPGESSNTWLGKREFLRRHGWGFLVLSNGRLDDEILKSLKHGTTPADLARADAAVAITAARSEGFPPHTILFLDQEEGGRLLDEQSAYLLAWTEAVAASDYRPGVYASGQPVPDGPPLKGKAHTITTIDDIREQVKAKHLHEIAFFDAQDACPPAPGCTLATKPLAASGELDLTAWQYAQSPRRPEITRSCKATYAAPNGNADNCYAPGSPTLFLDMDAATSADPSHGR